MMVLHQVLEEQLGRRGDAVAPLRPVLRRILADIQERLTFRAQAFIKVWSSYQHTCASSIVAPLRLNYSLSKSAFKNCHTTFVMSHGFRVS